MNDEPITIGEEQTISQDASFTRGRRQREIPPHLVISEGKMLMFWKNVRFKEVVAYEKFQL